MTLGWIRGDDPLLGDDVVLEHLQVMPLLAADDIQPWVVALIIGGFFAVIFALIFIFMLGKYFNL